MTTKTTPTQQSGRGKQAQAVYTHLLDQIVRGRLHPGERVLEREVAEKFEISRTPAREALQRLTREGFLAPPRAGLRRGELRVTSLNWDDIAELWQITGSLESIAASRVSLLRIRDRELLASDLRELNRDLKERWNEDDPDPDIVFDLQSRFHRTLVGRCAGPHLLSAYESVRRHLERFEWLYGTRGASRSLLSLEEHELIAEAVFEGDGPRASQEVTSHWQLAAQRSIEVFKVAVDLPLPMMLDQ